MNVGGSVRPPGDKSITHRALLLAALARGPCELRGALAAADTRSMAGALRRLGARVSPVRPGAAVRVRGAGWRSPTTTLHCGNSGTAARLLLGALAGHPISARLTGDRSLRARPMARVTGPLQSMGARFTGRAHHLPLVIHGGSLHGFDYETPVASAQIKSALLLAGLAGRVPVRVTEPGPSRDHTERLLRSLGLALDIAGNTVSLREDAGEIPSFALDIPGDLSSAAFLIAAALLADDGELVVREVGLNPTRAGFLSVAERMGAHISRTGVHAMGGEPVADLVVAPAALRGTEVRASEVPSLVDEVPILAVLAARAEGETVFRSVGELRVKESDRLGLLASNLRALGARAEVQGEDLHVEGGSAPPKGRVETAGDHRLAMSFAVLGLLPGADVALSETTSPGVSYPDFHADLARVTRHAA